MRVITRTPVLALMTALVTTVFAVGCNNQAKTPGSAKISVSVGTAALQISDIARVDISISGGNPAVNPPIVATLTKASNGIQWTGNITGIPAGTARVFQASAYKDAAATQLIYQGSTTADITAGQTATIVIILQEQNVPAGPTNFAPVISAVTASQAQVTPGGVVSFGFTASDPDNNYPLVYEWSSSCTGTGGNGSFTVGNGSLAAAGSAQTSWTAPGVNGVTCTIGIKVADSNTVQGPSSVQTFLTVDVNATTGSANVAAFPNSAPVIQVFRGDIAYNYDTKSTSPVGGVGQAGQIFTTAIDPDGDDIRYDYNVACGASLPPPSNGPTDNANLEFITKTTASGNQSNPKWANPDPSKSCVFKVAVSDLCTANDCGANLPAGTPGQKPNGADRGGLTTGFLNFTAPAKPTHAPTIVRTIAPNASGPNGAAVVDPGTVYNLEVDATDPEGGNLSAVWTANVGTVGSAAGNKSGNLNSTNTWTSPATLSVGMQLSVAITSDKSGLQTVFTFNFVGSDPCVGQPDGTACDDGNACTTGTTCAAGHCGGGTPVVCSGGDQCKDAVCSPISGCGVTNKTDGTSCSDGNACTTADTCQAGVCTGGPPVVCTAADQCHGVGVCDPASGVCSSPVLPNGTSCNDGNACTQTDACAAGVCVGGNPVTCTGTVCASGGTCNPANGHCEGGTNAPSTTPCDTGSNGCTVNDHCNGNGACVAGTPFCPAGQTCNGGSPPTCTAPIPKPQFARDVQISPPSAVAVDPAGFAYVASSIFNNTPVSFDGIMLTSTGGADIFLARYDPSTGKATWAENFGDATGLDQIATGVAVTKDGTVAAIGNFSGSVTIGSSTINSASQIDFLAAFQSSNGAGKWAKQFDDGANGVLLAVAANPSSSTNLIAVCGKASAAATNLVPGATFGGLTDLVIGVFDSAGNRLWSAQIGLAGNEECDSLAIDDAGNVYAAGKFDSTSITFPPLAAIPGPGTTSQKFLWVAKFDGATGNALAAKAFNGTTGQATPTALGVDASGTVDVAGNFTGSLTFGAIPTLTSAGGQDVFVASLNPALSFAPNWAVRMGGAGPDSAFGIGATSSGDVVVTGGFQKTTTGVAALTANGTSASDVFLIKLAGTTGALEFGTPTAADKTANPAWYGDAATQTGDALVVNRFGSGTGLDAFVLGGTLNSTIAFPAPAGPVTATGVTDTFLVFGNIQ